MSDFEDYPELTGDIYEYMFSLSDMSSTTTPNISNKKEICYKKIYKDIYDDEIINYDQHTYMRCVMNIMESINDGEFSWIITKIHNILIFKQKYHEDESTQIENRLINMADKNSNNTQIYTDGDGIRRIIFMPELERQGNWCGLALEHPITILFTNIRRYIRLQYLCRSSIMDILYKGLKYTNTVLLKIELANRNVNKVNNAKFRALLVMTRIFRVDQVKSVKQMTIIAAEMNKLNYCTITRNGDKINRTLRKWFPSTY